MANLTKKQWNTLSSKTRKEILETIYGSLTPPGSNILINQEYKHDFDYDHIGKRLRNILSYCRVQSNGTIDVVVNITPEYIHKSAVTTKAKGPVKAKPAPTSNEPEVWYVDYETKDGDLNHVWVYAYSKDDAREKALREYWDIDEITNVYKKR